MFTSAGINLRMITGR